MVPSLSAMTTSQPTMLPPTTVPTTLPTTPPETTASPQPTTLPPTLPPTLPEIVLNNSLRMSIQEYTVDRVSGVAGMEEGRRWMREGERIEEEEGGRVLILSV